MKAILKGHSGNPSEIFLGVIGNYLIEVLDDDPVIQQIIASSSYQFQYSPSNGSRLSGTTKRMVLKTISDDALLILGTRTTKNREACKKIYFLNNSVISDTKPLRDARKLALQRWLKLAF